MRTFTGDVDVSDEEILDAAEEIFADRVKAAERALEEIESSARHRAEVLERHIADLKAERKRLQSIVVSLRREIKAAKED